MDRQHVHRLIDQLQPGQLAAVSHLLEVMIVPAVDDEPESDDERHAVATSKQWLKDNPGIPFEEVVAELGFTMDQIRGNPLSDRDTA